jgi:CheY-like chemotaxis protein
MEKIPSILIVDDDPCMVRLLREILEEIEDKGVELVIAGNGKDALGIIKTKIPELVILDNKMPVMNGLEACDIVKNILGFKNVYTLILSAKSQKLDIQNGKEAGADSLYNKAFLSR